MAAQRATVEARHSLTRKVEATAAAKSASAPAPAAPSQSAQAVTQPPLPLVDVPITDSVRCGPQKPDAKDACVAVLVF